MQVHLAQYNIATLRRPLGDPASVSYAALLDEVNALAEASPGFVWRHGIDSRDDSTSVYENPLTLVNMSVWESLEQLKDYAYKGFHRDVFRRRQEWFDGSGAVMWWIPAGTIPTLAEGVERLEFLRRHGPSPFGFETGQKHPRLVIVERSVTDADALRLSGGGVSAREVSAREVSGSGDVDRAVHVALLDGRPVGVAATIDGDVRVWTSEDPDGTATSTGEHHHWLAPALRTHARLAATS